MTADQNKSQAHDSHNIVPNKLTGLVNRFAMNLAALLPDNKGHFACPLCRRLFRDTDTALLSVEHVIPQSVGGRIEVVTCKKCNNELGTQIDSHIRRQIDMQAFLDGKLGMPIRQKVVSSSGSATADVAIIPKDDDLLVDVALIRKSSNPAQLSSLLRETQQGVTQLGFELTGNTKPDIRKARLSLLKSAYLMMFHYFGYGYIASEPAQVVHDQLARRDEDIVPLSIAIRPILASQRLHGIAIVIRPKELSCFYIPIEVSSSGSTHHFGVVLPGFLEPDKVYSRWKEFAAKSQDVNLTVSCFQPPAGIVPSPNEHSLPIAIWKSTIEGYSS